MLKPVVEGFGPIIEAKDSNPFRTQYEMLVATCNGCHHATQHGYVRITLPEGPSFRNRSFASGTEP